MAKQKKSATKKLLYVVGGLVITLGVGLVVAKSMGWLGGSGVKTEVETSEAKLKIITQEVSASGKIQPEVEVILRPEVSGEIIELPIKEGDYVAKGDLLVRIKPDIYQARIDEINASMLTQKARLEEAKANLLEAKNTYQQNKKLYESEAISESEYIRTKTAFEARKASFKAAKYQVQSIEAQLEQAKEELQKTIIRAPRKGTISKLPVEVGERVLGNTQSIGTELLRIAKMDQMEVQVQVNENDIVNVSVEDTANIEVDAYPDKTFKGLVTEIANSADVSGSGTAEQVTNYEVKIRVLTPHNLNMAGNKRIVPKASREVPEGTFTPSFKPGMSASVDVQTETARNVVSVPIQAVTVRDFADSSASDDSTKTDTTKQVVIPKEDLRKIVFVVEDGIAKRREVKTGISDNTHIQILNGVEAGDTIVTGSYRTLSKKLSDGDKVKVNNQIYSDLVSN
ncbi:efflux RND transporter periplasmic adaptor subunit [Fodinibius saliphilus]|uniref:efflux RND transporter periplasmic adaptor subunit n=1 Tax=Fodinibius saliphilus TaxID=1920650 RepID=UPI001107D0CF|nr:efflux RND transporter periplasmic adaptor subunit [Fodinibius saliphilus]